MPIKGITTEEEKIIFAILKPFKEQYNFYFYGSRVKGNFRPMSDLDILIHGKNPANTSDIEYLKEKFDNSNLSYIVNFVDFYNLNEKFYKIIEKDLVKLNL